MKFLKVIGGILLVVVVAVGGWFAWHSGSSSGLANITVGAKLTDQQVSQIVANVGHFMTVPDETPSVSVISDAASLAAQQDFYRGAKDGDVLVVYSSRAIIYDPKADKLVNVGPIVQNTASPAPLASGSAAFTPGPVTSLSPSATPGTPEKVTVDVRNGTSTAGLAGATASTLKKNSWVTIGTLGDAQGSYSKTVLVDLTHGKKPNAVATLASQLGVTSVIDIPAGEQASTADILVIVGK